MDNELRQAQEKLEKAVEDVKNKLNEVMVKTEKTSIFTKVFNFLKNFFAMVVLLINRLR